MLPYVSPLIILGEILLGLALLSGRQVRHCLAVCEVLFYTFALAFANVLHRGLQIRCACFGVFRLKVSPWHCLICLAVALYLSWRRQQSACHRPRELPFVGNTRTVTITVLVVT